MNMKEQTKVAEQTRDLMCIKCKSFFGNEAFGNMCSQCFKKHAPESVPHKQQLCTPAKQTDPVELKQEQKKQEKKEINKDRCTSCNRRLKLLGIECRCGFCFCSSHRLPQDHSCTFDHKIAGKQRLIKEVVRVQNGKIESI